MKCNACKHEYTNKEKGVIDISSKGTVSGAIAKVGDKHLGAVDLIFCPKCGTVSVRGNWHKFELE